MKEEDVLLAKIGKKNPFKVPENYFDDLTAHIMENLPESNMNEEIEIIPKVTLFTRIKPYLYLAAMFTGLYFGIQVFKFQAAKIERSKETAKTTATQSTEDYVDQVCNYTMIDNGDIYYYLADN